MILWRRTIGVGLGLAMASSLCSVALAAPDQEERVDAPSVMYVDDRDDVGSEGDSAAHQPIEPVVVVVDPSLESEEIVEIIVPAIAEPIALPAMADPVPEVTAVPPEVVANLSEAQMQAIARIILNADTVQQDIGATLPTEVLARLDTLPGLEQQLGRRRRLPFGLVRRLRLPQQILSLVRQPRNAALVMLGNHIMVVNPVTGAILGTVLSVF
jgi:hypothetical protein